MLRTDELDYDLPEHAIATTPAEPRDAARLMRIERREGGLTKHAAIRDLPGMLRPGDLLILNTTRVLPARLEGIRTDTGARVEGLYLHAAANADAAVNERRWVLLLKAKKPREGLTVRCDAALGEGIALTLRHRSFAEPGAWVARVEADNQPDHAILSRIGATPLPPYILAARRHGQIDMPDAYDRARYQTVYADQTGSVAAPTAGLHLAPTVLDALTDRGVLRADVVLHVGIGTFKPVETEYVEQHPIHAEWCSMNAETRGAILRARRDGRRVICIGTTSARTVETFAALHERGDTRTEVETRLLITPGYAWRWTDGLLTNFHLPRSTLLAMCGALIDGGVERLKSVYADAMTRGYRFFSYGDAMLIADE
ncbi:MAG: tRNA preQ1(34) S-adenosylmethionine ribosyltransferase-isomerase QueA [Phycisphaerae bacterium]|nr:tRNA preQ1(34) S-adenosylmethionine ribosyltransferase-isomerase QueA [Phycisphaerae bacterium]